MIFFERYIRYCNCIHLEKCTLKFLTFIIRIEKKNQILIPIIRFWLYVHSVYMHISIRDRVSFFALNYPSELFDIPSVTLRRRVEVSAGDTLGDVKITNDET